MWILTMRQKKVDSNSPRNEQRKRAEKLNEQKQSNKVLQETPPRHLDRISSRLWTQLVPTLNKSGLINESDKSLLEAFVMSYSLMRQAWESIKNDGATYSSDTGRVYKNPNVDILSDQQGKIKSLGTELGLSPQARANLVDVSLKDDTEEFDKLMKQFGGN